jgi:hypothetical protein
MPKTYRDLTSEELRYCGRDILAERLAAIQAERAELLKQLAAAKTVEVDHRVIMAFIQAPDEPDGDIGGPLRVAFRAAGLTVAGGDDRA